MGLRFASGAVYFPYVCRYKLYNFSLECKLVESIRDLLNLGVK